MHVHVAGFSVIASIQRLNEDTTGDIGERESERE
jgi:hypothetical protein